MGGRTLAECIQNWIELNEKGQRGMKKIRARDDGAKGSVSYDNDVLYSYRTPIARYFHEGKFVLLSSRDYSVTTSKHRSMARRWIEWRLFSVPYISSYGGWASDRPSDWHAENVAHFKKRMAEVSEQAIRQYRSVYQDWWRDQITDLHRDMTDYMRLNKLGRAGVKPLAGLINHVQHERNVKRDQFNSPQEVTRRERAAARALAREAFNLGDKK